MSLKMGLFVCPVCVSCTSLVYLWGDSLDKWSKKYYKLSLVLVIFHPWRVQQYPLVYG